MRLTDAQLDRWERALVVASVVGTGVLIHRGTLSDFQVVKAALLWIAGIVALGLVVLRGAAEGTVSRWRSPVRYVAVGFVALLVVAAVMSPTPVMSLVGPYARYTGVATYASGVLLFLLVSGHRGAGLPRTLVRATVASGGVVSLYAVLQRLGLDPLEWPESELQGAFATMGNPNFASAYVAIAVTVAIGSLVSERDAPIWRSLAGVTAVLGAAGLWATASEQGVFAAAAGIAVLALGHALARRGLRSRFASDPSWRRWGTVGLAVGALVGILVVAALFTGRLDVFGERALIYPAALDVAADNPLFGVGPGNFADVFPQYRPVEHAVAFAGTSTDTAHSVPLELLVSGGVLTALAYVAFIVLVAVAGITTFVVAAPRDAHILLAVLAGWVAYQVQSLVSIDVPALAVLNWVLAGAVVGLSRSVAEAAEARSGKAPRRTTRHRVPVPAVVAVLVAVVAVGWVATRPLRADLAVGSALELVGSDQAAGFERIRQGQGLLPGESTYHFVQAGALERVGEQEAALAALDRAAALEPGSARYALFAARLADQLGQEDVAADWFREAARRDPKNPAVLREAGENLVAGGNETEGRAFLERAEEMAA